MSPRCHCSVAARRLFLVGAFLALFPPRSYAMMVTITVAPQDQECLIVTATDGGVLSGSFEMLDDDVVADPFALSVQDMSSGRILYQSRRKYAEGTFELNVDSVPRRFAICVSNGAVGKIKNTARRKHGAARNVDGLPRTCGLDFRVEPRTVADEIHETNEALLDRTKAVYRTLSDLLSHYNYLRVREAKHREVVEETFTKLLTWLLFEAGGVLVLAGGQVLYLRRFLEQKRYM